MSGRFEVLRESLLRHGIAPRHVHRYARELEEHFSDLVSEEMEKGLSRPLAAIQAEHRLGRMEDLIEAMAARKELRSWIGRMPRTILIGGPLLTFILILLIQLFGMAELVENFGGAPYRWGGRLPPLWLHPILAWGFPFDNFMLPLLLGWAFAAASLRQRIGKGWVFGGLAILALAAGTSTANYRWPSNPMDDWSFGFGFFFAAQRWGWAICLSRCVIGFLLMAGPFWFLFRSKDRSAPFARHLPGRY
jgi:hypothetical protein